MAKTKNSEKPLDAGVETMKWCKALVLLLMPECTPMSKGKLSQIKLLNKAGFDSNEISEIVEMEYEAVVKALSRDKAKRAPKPST